MEKIQVNIGPKVTLPMPFQVESFITSNGFPEIEITHNITSKLLPKYKLQQINKEGIVKLFLINHKSNINREKELLKNYHDSQLVISLLADGVDPFCVNKNGDTVMHFLCNDKRKTYDRQLCKKICEKNPVIKSIRNKQGCTPYDLAKSTKKYDLLYITGLYICNDYYKENSFIRFYYGFYHFQHPERELFFK